MNLPRLSLVLLTAIAAGCGSVPDQVPPPVAGRFNCTEPIKIQNPQSRIGALTAKAVKGSCNDTDKAYGIYRWITANIAYDTERFYARTYETQTAEQVLDSREAVCEGFSALYQAMAEQAGLKSRIAQGRVKTMDNGEITGPETPNHQWNLVYLNKQWHFVDSTWGAGYSDRSKGFVKNNSDKYFLMSPYLHSITHWDFEDNFGIQRKTKLTYEEFERLNDAEEKLLEIGFDPKIVYQVARSRAPAPIVTVYDNASQFIRLNDPNGLYLQLPKNAVNIEVTLKKDIALSLYANDQFVPLPPANDGKQTIKTPAHLTGKIVLLAEHPKNSGEYTGLLAYQR